MSEIKKRLINLIEKFTITEKEKQFHKETVYNSNEKELSYLSYLWEFEGVYKEYPVDIETFIHDPYYLGNIYHNNIFPIWENLLKEVYPAPLITRYNEVITSAGTRSGKSHVSLISVSYEIYKLLCMVDPAGFYLNNSTSVLVIGLLSFSEDNIKKYVQKLENCLILSPVFKDKIQTNLAMSNITKGGTYINRNIILSAGSEKGRITGGDLFCCVMDEANQKPNNVSQEDFLSKRLELWEVALDRKSSTLSKAPPMSGIAWLISSPTETDDVINKRIERVNKNNIKSVKILDNVSRWVARDEISKDNFDFYLGSDTKDPRILNNPEDFSNLKLGNIIEKGIDYTQYEKGTILHIPYTDLKKEEDYVSQFTDKTVLSIREVAGRRTSSDTALFNTVSTFEKVFSKENDIFSKDILTINFIEGKQFNFEDYLINKDYFKNCNNKNCYRYIHLDIASRRDRFGLCSIYSDIIKFKSEDNIKISKRIYFIDFCLGVVASSGCEVDIIKVLEFLYKIKKEGYPIKVITTDSHQGILARQHIKSHGVNTKLLSVETSKDPYYNLKTTILTESLVGYKNETLIKELVGLRDYENKISKSKGCTDDLSDALAGALYSCSLDKHHFKNTNDVMDEIIKSQSDFKNRFNITDMTKILNKDYTNDIDYIDYLHFNNINNNNDKGNGKLGLGY